MFPLTHQLELQRCIETYPHLTYAVLPHLPHLHTRFIQLGRFRRRCHCTHTRTYTPTHSNTKEHEEEKQNRTMDWNSNLSAWSEHLKKNKKNLSMSIIPLCAIFPDLQYISKKEERNAVMSSPSSSQQWKTCSVELIPSGMWESSLGDARGIWAWGVCCMCVSAITPSVDAYIWAFWWCVTRYDHKVFCWFITSFKFHVTFQDVSSS